MAYLDFPLYQRLFAEREAARVEDPHLEELKLQREFSRAIAKRIADEVQTEEQDVGQNHVYDSDMVYAHTPGRPTLFLLAPLSQPHYRMWPSKFVAWFRRVLRIPQLAKLDNARQVLGHDGMRERCLGTHSKTAEARVLDLWGNHDNASCPPTYKGRARGHTKLKMGIIRLARTAGVAAESEPRTEGLLRGQFTAAACTTLFPKKPAKKYITKVNALVERALVIAALQSGTERTRRHAEWSADLKILKEQAPPSMQALAEERKGLRVDVQLLDRDTDEELWLDVTVMQHML